MQQLTADHFQALVTMYFYLCYLSRVLPTQISFILQVAGLPTNIDFILKLANHEAFKNGDVETHFIENFRDDLFVDPSHMELAKEAYDAAKTSAILVAACFCEKEHVSLRKSPPGKDQEPGHFQDM